MAQSRVIKRYANRKMYDTSRSCYVTLEEVADMVREGLDVRVVDNKTKDDLTEVTLTQALLDTERRNRGSVPLSGLRHLISSGNDFLARRVAEPVIRVRADAERTVTAWKDEAERTVSAWKSEAEKAAERVLHRKAEGEPVDEAEALRPSGEGGEPGSAVPDGKSRATSRQRRPLLIEQTQRVYDELQHRVDEQLRHAIAALGLVTHDHDTVARLEARIAALEARIATLEPAADRAQAPAEAHAPLRRG